MKKDNAVVAVPSSVAVLLPCRDKESSDGGAFIYQDGWARARRVRVMRAYQKDELMKAARENPGWVDFISGVKKLIAAEERPDDSVLIRDAHERMAPYLGLTSKRPTEFFKDAWFLVSGAMAFDGVRLTLWQTKADKKGRKEVLLGLYCPDSKAAVAADMLLRRDFKICTHCNVPFMAKRPKQTACSVKCREAHRSARFYRKYHPEEAV
jgi:hypothetical protein